MVWFAGYGVGKVEEEASGLCKATGNSIVVACMEGIFEGYFFPKGEPKVADDGQLCLF